MTIPVPALGEDLPPPLYTLFQPHNPGSSTETLLDLEEFPCLLLVERTVTRNFATITENLDPVLQTGDIHQSFTDPETGLHLHKSSGSFTDADAGCPMLRPPMGKQRLHVVRR